MKTKLLKRLRKEAKKHCRIKLIGREYYIWDSNIGCFDYRYRPSLSYKCLKDAESVCNEIRRNYILGGVKCLREEQDAFIDF